MRKLQHTPGFGVLSSLQKRVMMGSLLGPVLPPHGPLFPKFSLFPLPHTHCKPRGSDSSELSSLRGNEQAPSHVQATANALKVRTSQLQMPCMSQQRAPGPQLQNQAAEQQGHSSSPAASCLRQTFHLK